MSQPRLDLQQWTRELAQNQMPVFAQTANTIAKSADDEDSSARQLAQQILQDVSMTTRLLRMANSSHFNPSGGKITTISRAIILLGFNVVRDLCLSIAVVDTFLEGPHRELATAEMALSFHAAMQARGLAEISGQRNAEEVFIATLLSHLGELAFLCFSPKLDPIAVSSLVAARRRDPSKREEVEREQLGFPIRELTAALNREWRLSPLLGSALDPRSAKNDATDTIGFGRELAELLHSGAPEASLQACVQKIAKRLGVDALQLRQQVALNARAAIDTVNRLGAPSAAKLIPQLQAEPATTTPASTHRSASPAAAPPVAGHAPSAGTTASNGVGEAFERPQPADPWHAGDSELQLGILRDLSHLLVETRPSVAVLMELILEGVLRGVGMDRVIFALLTPDRKHLRAKSMLCVDGHTSVPFEFALQPPGASLFERLLRSGESLWIGNPKSQVNLDPALRQLSGGHCFAMPLAVGGTPIGLLYADRRVSARPLSEELFTQFKLFGQQARLGLSYIKSR